MAVSPLAWAQAHPIQSVVFAPALYFVAKFLYSIFYNLYLHPLSKYPGPALWTASELPRIRSVLKGDIMWDMVELHKKYGKVVRIAPSQLSWIDEGVWKDVWAHRQGHQEFMKSEALRFPHPNGLHGILTATRENHSRFRRLLSHAFSEKGMREQQPRIISYVDMLIKDLKQVSKEGSQDMVQWFNFTTFDVIGKLAFGEDFGCLRTMEEHKWMKIVFQNMKAFVVTSIFRVLDIAWILPYLIPKKAADARAYNWQHCVDMITARVKRGTEELDFWDNVLKHQDKDTGMSFQEMCSNSSNLVLAGSETTATLLSGCIYNLCSHPEALKRLTKEIRDAYTSDTEIDLFSTAKLKYTLAVLEETMRIYPPVPMQNARVVPKGGDTIVGDFIPEGTTIHLTHYVTNHYPPYWMKPEEFHPERFLSESEDPAAAEFKDDNKAVFQPFGVGSRNCIGRNLAYAEMRLILVRFLWNFDVRFDEAKMKEQGEWLDQKVFTLWEKKPLWIELTPVH